MVLSADGKTIVSGSADGTLRFWDPAIKLSRYTVEKYR